MLVLVQAAAHKGLHRTVAETHARLDTAGFAAVGAAAAEPATAAVTADACKAAGRKMLDRSHCSPVAEAACTGCS